MTTRMYGLTYDAHDALGLAQFWAAALNSQVADGGTPSDATVVAADWPRMGFHQVPEPKTAKNRLHLVTDDLAAEHQRLLGLGAVTVNEVVNAPAHWVTLHDPEGNEFDLIQA